MKKQPEKEPDEATLTRWMDGELEGDELERIESWAQEQPDLLAERDAVHAMRASIKGSLPASVEPPYAEFFNQRILRRIGEESPPAAGAKAQGTMQPLGAQLWRWLAYPAAAAAMVLCFYLGTQVGVGPQQPPRAIAVSAAPLIYTPDRNVTADMFNSENGDATVIVLEGLEAIPDDFDIVGVPWQERSGERDTVMVSAELVF